MKSKDGAALAIGHAVRGAIAQADLTQAEAAQRAGIALNTFSRRINGLTAFTWTEIVRVAEATGVSATDLVTAAERIQARASEGRLKKAVSA